MNKTHRTFILKYQNTNKKYQTGMFDAYTFNQRGRTASATACRID